MAQALASVSLADARRSLGAVKAKAGALEAVLDGELPTPEDGRAGALAEEVVAAARMTRKHVKEAAAAMRQQPTGGAKAQAARTGNADRGVGPRRAWRATSAKPTGFVGKPLKSPRAANEDGQQPPTTLDALCTPKFHAITVRAVRNGAPLSTATPLLVPRKTGTVDDVCVPTNLAYKALLVNAQQKLKLAAPVKALYAAEGGTRRARLSEFVPNEIVIVVPHGEALSIADAAAVDPEERKAQRARLREQRTLAKRLATTKTFVRRVAVNLLPTAMLAKEKAARTAAAAPPVSLTLPVGVPLADAVALAEEAVGAQLMPPGCALYHNTGRAFDDAAVATVPDGTTLYFRAVGQPAPPKAVTRRAIGESVKRLSTPRPTNATVVITAHRLGQPLDAGTPVTITARVGTLEELYKRVASSVVPPPLNGVKVVYTSRGKPVEHVSALKHGQHVSYACFGDAIPLNATAARRRAVRAAASARRRASRPDLQLPRARQMALVKAAAKTAGKVRRRRRIVRKKAKPAKQYEFFEEDVPEPVGYPTGAPMFSVAMELSETAQVELI